MSDNLNQVGLDVLIDAMIPEFIRDQDPNFVAFVKAYYAWLDDPNGGAAAYHTRRMMDYTNVDETTEEFIQHFKKVYLPFFPDTTELSERKLLKLATKFYNKKGSEESFKFLFRVLFGKDVEIYYPKKQILKASDGKWQLPLGVRLFVSDENINIDVSQLVGRYGVGSISNTTCVIESVVRTIEPFYNVEVFDVYLSNINREFQLGEDLVIQYDTDVQGNPLYFSERIIGSVSRVTVDSRYRGLRYRGSYDPAGSYYGTGDPVVFYGGLNETAEARKAVALVGNVTVGQIEGVSLIDGGYGYSLHPNTWIDIITDPGDPGTGANVIVDGIDTNNIEFILFNTDAIEYHKNILLNAGDYGFPNVANANLLTTLIEAFATSNIGLAPIDSITVVSGGGGYQSIPQLAPISTFETDYSVDVFQEYLLSPNTATYDAWRDSEGKVRDIGRVAAIEINNGGSGYSNVTDKIYINTAVGYDFEAEFSTDLSGKIISVTILDHGLGYPIPKPAVTVANSLNVSVSSAGTGAQLVAFGDNDGEELDIAVSDIGRIIDFRIISRGFDYISTPNVSMRIQDITVTQIANVDFYFEGEVVFQGANANSSTFFGYVDEYDRANSVLRVYNYIGSLNLAQNLESTNISTIPLETTIYGNGKAKANAEFFGGLIRYPGFYLNTDGFLSSDMKIQDDIIYHNFSYIVTVEEALRKYKDTLMDIVHPAGLSMLGRFTISSQEPIYKKAVDWMGVDIILTSNALANATGTLTTVPTSNAVVGFGTNFGDVVEVGDMIIFKDQPMYLAKEVTEVVNDEFLYIESGVAYIAFETVRTTNGSNVLVSAAEFASNVQVNDTIYLANSDGGNAQTCLVVQVSGNSITTNTVFTANANVHYEIRSQVDNVAWMV